MTDGECTLAALVGCAGLALLLAFYALREIGLFDGLAALVAR